MGRWRIRKINLDSLTFARQHYVSWQIYIFYTFGAVIRRRAVVLGYASIQKHRKKNQFLFQQCTLVYLSKSSVNRSDVWYSSFYCGCTIWHSMGHFECHKTNTILFKDSIFLNCSSCQYLFVTDTKILIINGARFAIQLEHMWPDGWI